MRLRRSDAIDTFDVLADDYDRRFGAGVAPQHDAVLERAATHGVAGSVLDIGCGTGALLDAIARRWPDARLAGLDPSAGMLRVARARRPDADFALGVAERMPYPDASIDVAFSTTSFGQWRDQPAGLHEVRRVLRPGGRLYLAELRPVSRWRRALYRVPRFRDVPATVRLLTGAGLVVVESTVHPGGFVVTVASKSDESAHVAAV